MTPGESREQALQVLYAADALGAAPDLEGVTAKAAMLAEGVWEHREELDAMIASRARGWRVERMPAVDRTLLRMGAFELLHTDTPVGVIVSEAVELAKRYSTGRSGSFINGVLGALARDTPRPGR